MSASKNSASGVPSEPSADGLVLHDDAADELAAPGAVEGISR